MSPVNQRRHQARDGAGAPGGPPRQSPARGAPDPALRSGLPGPDRGAGGRYLLLPPGYDGPLPDGGFQNVSRVRTNRVCVLGRSFMVDNDPAPVVATIKDTMRIYPYVPGATGMSVATLLKGEVPMAASTPPDLVYHEGTGLEINTVPPNDERFFDVVNEAIQDEPTEAGDPEITVQLEAIGIVRGKPFAPDERTRRLLADAVAVGNATARSLVFHPREDEHFGHYDDGSAWSNSLFVGGYEFMTPPPVVTPQGIRPFPATGARKLNARTNFFYYATGDSPAMCMRLTG